MDLSTFYAQVIGLWLVLLSAASLTQKARFKKLHLDSLSHESSQVFSGVLGLAAGLLIVTSHCVWVQAWPVLITLFGWVLIIQSIMRVYFLEAYVNYMKKLLAKSGYTLLNTFWLVIGLLLVWVGFSA